MQLKGKIKKKIMIGAFVASSTFLLLTSCVKKVDCNVKDMHAHEYVNSNGLTTVMASEKEKNNGFERSDKYIFISEEDKKYIDFLNKNKLISIDNNITAINSLAERDYLEYEYTKHNISISLGYNPSNNSLSYVPTTSKEYYWSADKDKSGATHRERIAHQVYYGYNVVKNDKGKFEIVKSEVFDNIEDLLNQSNYKFVMLDRDGKISEFDYIYDAWEIHEFKENLKQQNNDLTL